MVDGQEGIGAKCRLVVLVPQLNDWASCAILAEELDREIAQGLPSCEARLVVMDDGSSLDGSDFHQRVAALGTLRTEVRRLSFTSGHQQAIASGLQSLVPEIDDETVVAVMDADGEDRPSDVPRLVHALRESGSSVVTATRGRRYESRSFRVLYRCYRSMFWLMTGRKLANGNFMVLNAAAVRQIAFRPALGIHVAATVARFAGKTSTVVCDRGTRYQGKSRMNRNSLMLHAFGAVATYGDLVALRLAIGAFFLTVLSLGGIGVSVLIRLTTNRAIPGWATYVGLGLLAIAIQSLLVAITALVLFISTRSSANPTPSLTKSR